MEKTLKFIFVETGRYTSIALPTLEEAFVTNINMEYEI